CYRFNRRFDLRSLHQRLLIAAAGTTPQPLRVIRVADVHC
ncbi:MAG: IS1595 family transposase, partial [Burkholderiaceae bacterium]|nr:IS1595 family transposase [Burkholderiaceae bacterium]MBW6496144.1 IS1595 family transposase [Burkholderiaceae bacterium]